MFDIWRQTKRRSSVKKVNIFGRFNSLSVSASQNVLLQVCLFTLFLFWERLIHTQLSNVITESCFYKAGIFWPFRGLYIQTCTAQRQLKCDGDGGQISNLKIRSELKLRIVHNKTDDSSLMQIQVENNTSCNWI